MVRSGGGRGPHRFHAGRPDPPDGPPLARRRRPARRPALAGRRRQGAGFPDAPAGGGGRVCSLHPPPRRKRAGGPGLHTNRSAPLRRRDGAGTLPAGRPHGFGAGFGLQPGRQDAGLRRRRRPRQDLGPRLRPGAPQPGGTRRRLALRRVFSGRRPSGFRRSRWDRPPVGPGWRAGPPRLHGRRWADGIHRLPPVGPHAGVLQPGRRGSILGRRHRRGRRRRR